ncbi:hypothetical protein FOA43_004507 [Brettanomyces nanus]|uniref:non-specific serine/threonine protein kinase n=1 Tax=Eeniella nana TaxID=13502 RepID=A0A875SEN4_EENNA|nr:uncharacterized protein FOA43_004507 [Brettanomyces nanus]QPG77104.1 hypothetical protein FOA43_004507 [Brettanomyces nanus]
MIAHRLSFSKHSLPKHLEKHSNLSQCIAKERSNVDRTQKNVHSEHNASSSYDAHDDHDTQDYSGHQPQRPQLTVDTENATTTPYNPEDVISSDSDEDDENLRREEDPKDYCPGGYHPTFVGEHYGRSKEYLIVRKLGWGHFSTVWLAWDILHNRHVAIKIVRSSKNYREAAQDEIRILEKINSGPADHPGKHHIVQLLDHFIHEGPNGEHVCMVFEVLGENMLSLLLRYKQFQKEKTQEIRQRSSCVSDSAARTTSPTGLTDSTSPTGLRDSTSPTGPTSPTEFVGAVSATPTPPSPASAAPGPGVAPVTTPTPDSPPGDAFPDSLEFHISQLNDLTILRESYGGLPITLVKQISKQILLALDYLHKECGIIHTDLKPENVLVEIHDVERLVKMLELERLQKCKSRDHIITKHTRDREHAVDTTTVRITPRRHHMQSEVRRVSNSKHHNTPIRSSKPLTTPVEMSTSVENFFRSFSVGRPRSSTTPSQSLDRGQQSRNNSMIAMSPQLRPSSLSNIAFTGPSFQPDKTSTIEEDEEERFRDHIDDIIEEEEYVDAKEVPNSSVPVTGAKSYDEAVPLNLPTETFKKIKSPYLRYQVMSNYSPNGHSLLPNMTLNRFGSLSGEGGGSHSRGHQMNQPYIALPHAASPHISQSLPPEPSPTIRRGSTFSSTSSSSILNDLGSIISVKIADLGNACWYDMHYTNDIETRQYRGPEIILGGKWGCSTDLWSCACLIFELITGDYLFDPKSGSTYDKNDDHLAQMIELLQTWPPKDYLKKCKYSREFFDKSLQTLKHISKLKIWTMVEVLVEEYHIEEPLAKDISSFLLAMLEFEPRKRVDAGSMTNNTWLQETLVNEHIDRPFGLHGQDIKGYVNEYKGN